MASIANLVLPNDGTGTTPITFTAVGIRDGVASWKNKAGGIAAGYHEVTFSLREPTKAAPAYKVSAKIVVPKLETAAAFVVPTKAFESIVKIDVVIPDRASQEDRDRIFAYASYVLATKMMEDAIRKTESVFG